MNAVYTCRCGARHSQPQLGLRLDGVGTQLEVQLCPPCASEAVAFVRNEPTYPTWQSFTLPANLDVDEDDLDAALVDVDADDLRYELHKEAV